MSLSLILVLLMVSSFNFKLIQPSPPINSLSTAPDIHSNIWCYLKWKERLILRKASKSFCDIHCFLFLLESRTITQCYALSKRIQSIDPSSLIAFFSSNQYFEYLNPGILLMYKDDHNTMMIEKIMVDIVERAPSLANAFRTCILWLETFESRYKLYGNDHVRFASDRGMKLDAFGTATPCNRNLNKLLEIFQWAETEMEQTGSKYNRYTRFAFKFMDSMLISLDDENQEIRSKHKKDPVKDYVLRCLWSEIVSVEFITDYLERPHLRNFDEVVPVAMDLLLEDAVQFNESLNEERLMLMVHHPSILFNFELIVLEFAHFASWSRRSRVLMLNFIAKHDLMSWSSMKQNLRHFALISPRDPALGFMWQYACFKHAAESNGNNARNPLLPCEAKKRKNDQPVSRLIRKKPSCCICM